MTVLEKYQFLLDNLAASVRANNVEFQSLLKQKYPLLTPYDLRLCIYLKANFSTKEIAAILNITPDSAKKAKHRLRKKMHIRPDEGFVEFFLRSVISNPPDLPSSSNT